MSGVRDQEWFTAAELVALKLPGLPTAVRSLRRIVERDGWEHARDPADRVLSRPRQGRGGGVEYHLGVLPESARVALAGGRSAPPAPTPPASRESAWARFERLPKGLRDAAEERLAVLARVDDLERAGLSRSRAIDEVVCRATREAQLTGTEPPYGVGTVYAWSRRVAGIAAADRLAYLAPDYTGRTTKAPCPPEAWDRYLGDYLRQEQPTHAACYRRLQVVAAERGWSIPSAKTMERRLDAEIPQPVQIVRRQGDAALAHSYPHLTRDRSGLAPMQIGNLDGHTWDVRVRWEDGTEGRPISLAVQDIASSRVMACRFDRTLNRHLVRLALGDVFAAHGLFDTVIMDNGRENAARDISGGQATRWRWKLRDDEPDGLLKLLGVKAVFATPYWGQAKPIERMFRDWAGEIAKHPAFHGAYTGPNTQAKPDNYGARAVPIAEFQAVVAVELERYNAQLGRGGTHLAGRSFDQAFEQGLRARDIPPVRLTQAQRNLCLLASHAVSQDPRSGAVSIEGHRYWHAVLGDRARGKVMLRFDPEALDRPVHVYTLDGVYLCEAARIEAGSFDRQADAEGQRRKVREYRRAAKTAAAALVRLTPADVAAALVNGSASVPDADAADRREAGAASRTSAETNVVRPAFGAPRTVEQAAPTKPSFDDLWHRGVAALPGAG